MRNGANAGNKIDYIGVSTNKREVNFFDAYGNRVDLPMMVLIERGKMYGQRETSDYMLPFHLLPVFRIYQDRKGH
ncbi:hypothetical protein Ga0451573_003807 [Peptococcaceae bacterium DYL19]|nr:hypothetical protein [Phosphitispora fastidiosa]